MSFEKEFELLQIKAGHYGWSEHSNRLRNLILIRDLEEKERRL